MYDVNVFGIISVTQGFAPLLIASKGTIINIGSVAGFSPVPWQGYYNASKASVHLLSHQLRLELSPWGVKVIEIITGGIRTHFWQNVYSSPTLPENSLYLPARKEIESIMQGELIDKEKGKDADVDVYAEAVVSNALKSNPTKEHWVGSNSFIVWFASNFWPQFIWVRSALLVPLMMLYGSFQPNRILFFPGFSTWQSHSRRSKRKQGKRSRCRSPGVGEYEWVIPSHVYFHCLLLTRHII
jgi:1-acylglycerone phosphate reductase